MPGIVIIGNYSCSGLELECFLPVVAFKDIGLREIRHLQQLPNTAFH